MSYEIKLLDQQLLSGTPKSDVAIYKLPPGPPKLGICLAYEKGSGSSGGKPGYRLYWRIPGIGEVLATIRTVKTAADIGTSETTFREYQAVVVCEDLLESDGQLITSRTVDIEEGAVAVRFEPFEAGDTGHGGTLTAWMTRRSS